MIVKDIKEIMENGERIKVFQKGKMIFAGFAHEFNMHDNATVTKIHADSSFDNIITIFHYMKIYIT